MCKKEKRTVLREKKKEEGCVLGCAKSMLISLNTIFIVLSAALFIGGMILRFDSSIMDEHDETIQGILQSLLTMAGFDTSTTPKIKLTDLLQSLAITLIVVGFLLMALSLVGACGACCNVKALLVTYIVILVVLVLSQAVVWGLLYGNVNVMHDAMKSPLVDGLKSSYMGLNGTNLVSFAWNYIMNEFQCCGVHSYEDFSDADIWVRDYGSNGILKTPLVCCKTGISENDYSCAVSPTQNNSNSNVGCFDKMWKEVFGDATIAGSIITGCFLLQIILVISACVIFCYLREDRQITPLEAVLDDGDKDGREDGRKETKPTLKERAKRFLPL